MSLVTSVFLSALPHGTCLTEMLRNDNTFLEHVLRRHALRVGLCVFQQTFEVLVVDRYLELLEDSEKEICKHLPK